MAQISICDGSNILYIRSFAYPAFTVGSPAACDNGLGRMAHVFQEFPALEATSYGFPERRRDPSQGEPPIKTATCAPCDDENCCCNSGRTPRSKTVIFATVMLLAVGVAAYSMVKKNGAAASGTSSASTSKGDDGAGSLSEIRLESVEAAEKLATERDVTFLVLPGQDASSTNAACDRSRQHLANSSSRDRRLRPLPFPKAPGPTVQC